MHTIGQVNNELGMRLQVQGPHPLLCGPPSSDAGEAFYSWGFVGFEDWPGRVAFPGWGRYRACEAEGVLRLGRG